MPPEEVFDPSGPSSSRPQQQRRGCLGNSLMILGIVTAVCFLICCGVGVFMFSKFRGAVKTEPAEITAVQQKIVDLDIPEEMKPAVAIDLDLFGFFATQIVAYGNQVEVAQADGQAEGKFVGEFLMLIQMQIQDTDPAQVEAQLRNQSDEQGVDIRIESQETRTIAVEGRDVEFQFAKGTNTEDNTPVRTVSGVFQGRNGATLFILVVPEEKWNDEEWNEERATQLIQSIRH